MYYFFPIELSYNNTGLLYGFITFLNLIRNVNIEKLQLLNNTNRINITAWYLHGSNISSHFYFKYISLHL